MKWILLISVFFLTDSIDTINVEQIKEVQTDIDSIKIQLNEIMELFEIDTTKIKEDEI